MFLHPHQSLQWPWGGHNSNEGKMDGPDRESIKQRRVSRPEDLCSEGVCQCGYLTMEVIENK